MGRKLLAAVVAAGFTLGMASLALAGPHWLKGTTEQKFKKLEDIQEAMGSVMMEFNQRMTTMYFAAKGGNWGLAAYQLDEAQEIAEVGEMTRPQFAADLKAFKSAHLSKVEEAIKSKSFDKFKGAFDDMVVACNNCHAAHGYPFIHYALPDRPVESLKYTP
ncbi:MAG: hypothetical protein M0Z52_13980 [Actinomycetota bacterium]|nr:hypothetical protein [Actinomycetota bacterium]